MYWNYISLGATETRIILRIESVTCMLQFLKLTLYTEVNLSVRFQDYFGHVWEHSDPALGNISAQPHTVVKQICFLKGKVLFLSLFCLPKN